MRLNAIIFDFDGVLVDSVNVKSRAFARLYRQYGDDVAAAVMRHHESNGGVSRYDKIRHYHKEFLGSVLSDKEVDVWANRFAQFVFSDVCKASMIDGAKEFLDSWHKKLPFFVASATPENELLKIVAHRKMGHYFEGIYGGPKSKDELVKNIITMFNLEPAKTLMIGDALTDYEAAMGSKIAFLGIGENNRFPTNTICMSNLNNLEQVLVDSF